MSKFKISSKYKASADQKKAITSLSKGIQDKIKHQTLLGVTGSGKTFSMAKIIEKVQQPTLVLTHNKTLAAQLYREFKNFFPDNAVEYFVSYYDYYQPEAYVASSDLYIEKDASINDEIDRLRLRATSSILERKDVIVVSSVSCIYGLGNPENFERFHVRVQVGDSLDRDNFLRKLITIYYERNDFSFLRGSFRVRGDIVEVFPAYNYQEAFRIEFFGEEIEKISQINPLTGKILKPLTSCYIYPAKHFVSSPEEMDLTIKLIEEELESRLIELKKEKKLVEAQRLASRVKYDMEMLVEMGYCSGVENYSRIISRRQEGERPACLLDFFKGRYLMFIDESHVTLPQVRAMYSGDRARKLNLVEYGFRLPSALDNRPLFFEEFEEVIDKVIFVSATPGDYELEKSKKIVEQIIRPTGLLDPLIELKPVKNQVDDLINEINKRTAKKERVLVTTLTKKMAEDLSSYFEEIGLKTRYLHSEIDTLERVELIKKLRQGEFDCLIGINLLREGLDIPEVSLVAILDADQEGFLRSYRSLVQTAGRAARNLNGKVIMYADHLTDSIKKTISETNRRRKIQENYNKKNNIKPESIKKDIVDIIEREYQNENNFLNLDTSYRSKFQAKNFKDLTDFTKNLKEEMLQAAGELNFEKAAFIRDQIMNLEKKENLLRKVKK